MKPSQVLPQPKAKNNAMSNPPRYHIRWSIRRDMPEMLAIEAASFNCPWTEKDFIICLRQRNSIGIVAEHKDRIVGYMVYELHKTQIQVLNFATAPDFLRRGVGTQMIAKLIGKLTAQRRNQITLEVCETNDDAILFYRSMGFRAVEVLRDYYIQHEEDAYRFVYRLDVTKNRISHLFQRGAT
jgi:ribosomal-protein-alanine N-acetyltransferase